MQHLGRFVSKMVMYTIYPWLSETALFNSWHELRRMRSCDVWRNDNGTHFPRKQNFTNVRIKVTSAALYRWSLKPSICDQYFMSGSNRDSTARLQKRCTGMIHTYFMKTLFSVQWLSKMRWNTVITSHQHIATCKLEYCLKNWETIYWSLRTVPFNTIRP